MSTYTAKWDRTGKTIFENTLGSWPKVLGKQEEPIDGAVFELGSETITIKKDIVLIDFAKPQNVSKEWAKLFLEQWNRAVLLWDNGHMFRVHVDEYQPYQLRDQQEYAFICCTWLIPNGFAEPHCVAEGG